MTKKSGGLNTGLEVLIGDLGHEVLNDTSDLGLQDLSITYLQPGRYQPRRDFNEEALNELAKSIAEHGVIQPLVVRPLEAKCYEIIAGERRFRAAKIAGLKTVPVVVTNYNDQQALAVALIENLQRADLNALEVAQSLQQLSEDFQLTHERIAVLVGRSRSSVSNFLRLLDLGEVAQTALGKKCIEMGHARALLSVNQAQQEYLVKKIQEKKMSVRQVEKAVKEMLDEKVAQPKLERKNIEIAHLEDRVGDYMGYKVVIKHQPKGKGEIRIQYNNLDEMEGILEKCGYKINN